MAAIGQGPQKTTSTRSYRNTATGGREDAAAQAAINDQTARPGGRTTPVLYATGERH